MRKRKVRTAIDRRTLFVVAALIAVLIGLALLMSR